MRVEDLQQQQESLTAQNELLIGQRDEKEKEIEQMKTTNEAQAATMRELEARTISLNAQLDECRSNEERFVQEAQSLQQTVSDELKKRTDEVESERAQHEEELAEKEAKHQRKIDEMVKEFEQKGKDMEQQF